MAKKNKVISNYLFNLSYNIFALIVPLITTPYISRVLAVESIGKYGYVHSIVLYFTAFVALGTKSYAIKRISRAQSREEISDVFWNVLSLRMIFGLLALAVYYIISIFYIEFHTVAYIQSFYIIAVIFDISWFFQGMQEFRIIVIRNFAIKIVSCALILFCVKSDSDFNLYVFCLAGLTAFGNLSLWPSLRKTIVKWKRLQPFCGIKEILILFIPTLALQIYSAIDQTMLGLFSPAMTENGYYEQSAKIISVLMTVVSSLSIVLLPKISDLFGKGDTKAVRVCMQRSYQFIFHISLPMCLGMISVSDVLVPWFLGEKYVDCVLLVNLFSFMFIINGINDITGFQYLVATERQSVYALSIVLGTLSNILLNFILIKEYEVVGAVVSSVISQVVVMLIQLSYLLVVTKEFRINDVFGQSWKVLISSLFMMCILQVIKPALSVNAVFKLVILVAIGIVIYLLTLVLLRDRYLINILKNLKKKLIF